MIELDLDFDSHEGDGMRWNSNDVASLLSEMEKLLPMTDTEHYQTEIDQFNWAAVKFGRYKAADCRKQWNGMMKNLRHHRTLTELIGDAKKFYETTPMPKKPFSPYMAYFLQERPEFKKRNPHLMCGQIAQILGKKYMELPAEEKQKYRDKYLEEKRLYNECHPYNKIGSSKRQKKRKIDERMSESELTELNFLDNNNVNEDLHEDQLNYTAPQTSCVLEKEKIGIERASIGEVEAVQKISADNIQPAEKSPFPRGKLVFNSEYTPDCEDKVILGFAIYARDHITKLVHTKDSEKILVITKLWNSLDHEERLPYIKRGQKLTLGAREKFVNDIFEGFQNTA